MDLHNEPVPTLAIGIQARSSSSRFPRKVWEMIGSKMMIEHVIDACTSSSEYISRFGLKNRIDSKVYLLVPDGDDLIDFHYRPLHYSLKKLLGEPITGPEKDVLRRYINLKEKTNCDYFVRVTGDCPLIPPEMITKAIYSAVLNKLDYCSNVHEKLRTHPDGYDVEVISKKALEWADKNAISESDREHVTTILRSDLVPDTFKFGHVVGGLFYGKKISVDTKEDLEVVREIYKKRQEIEGIVKTLPGKNAIYKMI